MESLSCPRCLCFLVLAVFFPIMQNHAVSCEIMPFKAESCDFGSWYCLDVPTDSGRICWSPKERVQFLFVYVAPHSTDLSVAASVCHGGVSQTWSSATTGWPCDEAAGRNTLRPQCLRAQADIFMGLKKLWQYLGLVSKVAMSWEERCHCLRLDCCLLGLQF